MIIRCISLSPKHKESNTIRLGKGTLAAAPAATAAGMCGSRTVYERDCRRQSHAAVAAVAPAVAAVAQAVAFQRARGSLFERVTFLRTGLM